MPKKDTDKLLLKERVPVRVCRKEGAGTACAPVGELSLAPGLEGAFTERLPVFLTDGAPRQLLYFVELKNRNGRSAGLSNSAMVVAGQAPGPVEGFTAEVRKQGVVLHWTPASRASEETAVRLHRRLLHAAPVVKEKQGPLTPAPEAIDENLLVELKPSRPGEAVDQSIRFGEAYEYEAQRVARVTVGGKVAELDGPFSPPVRVDAADVFPPAVPTGLAAVALTGENGAPPAPTYAIDLSWQPDTEADLAGYIVYRREGNGDWQRISPGQSSPGPAFHDAHVEAGHTYTYAVSAVDQSGHESARSAPAQETVPAP